jgi:hypothetical protein
VEEREERRGGRRRKEESAGQECGSKETLVKRVCLPPHIARQFHSKMEQVWKIMATHTATHICEYASGMTCRAPPEAV